MRIGLVAGFLLVGAAAFVPPFANAQHFSGQLNVAVVTGPRNTMTLKNVSGSAITNYPLRFGRPFLQGAIAHAPQVIVDGVPVATQADVKNRYPDGSVKFAVLAVVVPSLANGVPVSIGFQDQAAADNTPMTLAAMESMLPSGTATMTLTPVTGSPASADAGQMLADGNCIPWTSGPIAQTMQCADDTPTARYDIGFDGVHHPFRPRFNIDFWPSINKAFVRAIGTNGKSTELMDLTYNLTVAVGDQTYARDLTQDSYQHRTMSNWTRSFWIGGSPPEQVNIDNNLPYLASTRFIPNFDPSITISDADVTNYYLNLYTNRSQDIYALNSAPAPNRGLWQNYMPEPGGRSDIGPYPSWIGVWLYTGDWRMRKLSLAMADLAAAFPANLQETATGKRLSRYDLAGSATGLGKPISPADRRYLVLGSIWYINQNNPSPANGGLTFVGPVNLGPPWTFDGAHQPNPYYITYLLSGDPYYLSQMYNWANFTVMRTGCGDFGRAPPPSCSGGGLNDEVRGQGWVMRSRAEAAFIAPDADPEKTYLTYTTNDALARWIGGIARTPTSGIDASVYQSAPPVPGATSNMWQYGHTIGNYNSGPPGTWIYKNTVGPIHAVAAECDPSTASTCGDYSINRGTPKSPWTSDVATGHAPWMQNYMYYGVARATELGFASAPLKKWMSSFITGQIVQSGEPRLMAIYGMPYVSATTFDWFPDWPTVLAHIQPGYLCNPGIVCDTTVFSGGLPAYFLSQRYPDSYEAAAGAAAAMCEADNPDCRAAWDWVKINVAPYTRRGDYGIDPRWAIIPRTDNNVLPPIPVQ